MSFSSAVKDETTKLRLKTEGEKRSLLCALTHTAGSMTLGRGMGVQYVTENRSVAMQIARLAPELYPGLSASVAEKELERLKARNLVVSLAGGGCRPLLRDMGCLPESEEEFQRIGHIPEGFVDGEDNLRCFIRGAFLGAGSVNDPKKGYHLEIVCRRERFALELLELLNGYGLNARLTQRKSSFVVYIKEGECVADFLTLVGAVEATMEFENARIVRNLSNDLNRKTNFEDANMQKAAQAAAQQLVDIETIQREAGFASLPLRLRAAAEARLDNPEATLSELAELLDISKSGLNHRLSKLSGIAEELRISRGKQV